MNVFTKSIALAVLVTGASLAVADTTVKVGTPAPALKVAKWVKGTPVKSFEKGKVYVVEFWATWCGPCKQSIPHLTELAKKYKGKATFTGVSVWEKSAPKGEYASYGDKVNAFVKDWGDKMNYNVAWDGDEGVMAQSWMQAAGQNGIPTAFVIDQQGQIAWIGHPMANLDEVVGQVIEGKFDAKAEAARAAKEAEAMEASMAKTKPFMTAFQAKKWKDAVAEADKLFAADANAETMYGMAKFMALSNFDTPAANDYARKLANGIYKDNPNALNTLAWTMVDDKSTMSNPDFKVAVEIATIGVAAAKEGSMEQAYVLDTLAYAQYKSGDVKTAIATQERALKVADGVAGFDAATRAEMAARLAQFKKG